jgi:hypothetical protein
MLAGVARERRRRRRREKGKKKAEQTWRRPRFIP